jgi:hypothetical protein
MTSDQVPTHRDLLTNKALLGLNSFCETERVSTDITLRRIFRLGAATRPLTTLVDEGRS